MRQVITLLKMLLPFLLSLQSCNPGEKREEKKEGVIEKKVTDNSNLKKNVANISDINENIQVSDGWPPSTDGSTQMGILDADLAILMSQNYSQDVSKRFVEGETQEGRVDDATSIWFSLDVLKRFIEKTESSMRFSPYKSSLGIRIYYAKYPENVGDYPSIAGLLGVANKHTVFMVPTFNRYGILGEDIDFHYDHVGDPNNPNSFNKLIRSNIKPSIFGYVIKRSPFWSIQNHGGLRPPPASGDIVFPIGE